MLTQPSSDQAGGDRAEPANARNEKVETAVVVNQQQQLGNQALRGEYLPAGGTVTVHTLPGRGRSGEAARRAGSWL